MIGVYSILNTSTHETSVSTIAPAKHLHTREECIVFRNVFTRTKLRVQLLCQWHESMICTWSSSELALAIKTPSFSYAALVLCGGVALFILGVDQIEGVGYTLHRNCAEALCPRFSFLWGPPRVPPVRESQLSFCNLVAGMTHEVLWPGVPPAEKNRDGKEALHRGEHGSTWHHWGLVLRFTILCLAFDNGSFELKFSSSHKVASGSFARCQ
eukprot:3191123-Amphidinium_carterae.1